jgi:hypothetical protein
MEVIDLFYLDKEEVGLVVAKITNVPAIPCSLLI